MSQQLPSWIKPNTADAYNHSFAMLYCRELSDVRQMIDKTKEDNSFSTRETREFFKEVIRMAQFEMSYEDLKAAERREKMEGIHPSQQKKLITKRVAPKAEVVPIEPLSEESAKENKPPNNEGENPS